MGLLDFGARVITEYKADTKDIKSKLKELSGEEKKLAEQRLKDAEAHNAQLESQIKGLGKVALAIGAAGAAIAVGRAGFQAYAKETQLAAAAAGANIEKLSQAAGGLATRMELLEFAAKTQHGAFKLSNEQMETAQKAILAITRAGYDHAEATNKVTEALVKANGGALDDFGILVKSGSNDLENFNNLMDALAKKAGEADGSTAGTAESVARAGVKFEDAFNKVKTAIGQMVVALEPLISAAARLVGVAADLTGKIAEGYGELSGFASFIAGGGEDFLRKYGLQRDTKTGELYQSDPLGIVINELGGNFFEFAQGRARGQMQREGSQALLGGFQQFGRDLVGAGQGFGSTLDDTAGGLRQRRPRRGGGRVDDGYETLNLTNPFETPIDDTIDKGLEYARQAQAAFEAVAEQTREAAANSERLQVAMKDAQQALADYEDGRRQNFLESTFGKLEEFDLYARGFQALTGAVTSGYEAMVDGSMSFGAAFKMAIANALKASGSEMLVMALKETAYGFAALAWPGGQVSAASHFKSAALFAAGAAAAGVAAHAIGTGAGAGGGGGGSAAAASGARSYASNSGSGGNGEPTRIIVYADAFAEDSERSKRLQAEKIVKRAYGSGAVENN
jgi:hypothetical protein